jgi:Malectin domain
MTFTDSQHGKKGNEFETIDFDTTDESTNSEIIGNDPKRREVRRRSKTCRRWCRCLNYIILLAMVTCALYFTINKILDKIRRSTDFTNAVYTIRINTGASGPYYDSNDNYWLPDYKIGINDDFVVSVEGNDKNDDASTLTAISDMCPISVAVDTLAGETDANIYCTDRSFTAAGRFEIAIPENNAPYQIDLYFAEIIYNEIGERTFDVLIEDFIVEENYDIIKEAGGNGSNNKATRLTYVIDVDDGYVSIVLKSKVNSAKINGIVIQRTDTLGDRR